MPETPQRRSALAPAYTAGVFGAERPDGPGVTLCERRGLAIVHLAGYPKDPAFMAAVKERIGVELPTTPNTSAAGADWAVLWLAPDRWMLISASAAATALDGCPGAVNDVSHGRCVMRIEGPHARDVLAGGCTLDFHPDVFKPATCAQSSLHRVNVLYHFAGTDGPAYDIYAPRGFALSLWEALTDAAAEYGYRVDAVMEG